MTYRKIGGIHWLAFGRLRLAFCITKRRYRVNIREVSPEAQRLIVEHGLRAVLAKHKGAS